MSDNIDDFFKKKLDDFGDPDDGWDQPSAGVWAAAQSQLPVPKSVKFNTFFIIIATLLGVGLLSSIMYIRHLHQNEDNLITEIQTLNKQLSQKNQDFADLQTSCTKAQKINDKETIATNFQIEGLKHNLITSKKIIKQKQTEIEELYKHQQELKSKLRVLKTQSSTSPIISKDTILFAQKKYKPINNHKITTLESLPQTMIKYQDSLQFVPLNQPKLVEPTPIWKKFEVGAISSVLTYIIPVDNNIENTNNIQSESQNEKEYSEVNGVYFAYAPKPNLYFRAGIQASYFDFERSSIAGLIYDKSSEYTNIQGHLVNDFSLRSSTPFNEIEQEITVEIPQGTTLETGDLLIMTLTNYQNFKFLQMPLGVAYYRGNNKWQWEFQSGLLFNRLSIGNYQIQANFQANNIEIPIGDINILDETTIVKHFVSGYLSVGGNYQVTPSWQFQAGVRLEDNTFDIRSSNFLRFKNFNLGLNVNVNYRF